MVMADSTVSDIISTTTSTTTTTIKTTTTTQTLPDIYWYDFIGPAIAVLFVVVLVIACIKCILEICSECTLFNKCCRGQVNNDGGDAERQRNLSINIDLPPRYSTTVIASIDLENNIILETEAERIHRERRLEGSGSKVEEDKLPTYLEILEEDGTKEHQNLAFEGDEVDKATESNGGKLDEDLDNISVSTESNLPPPPPYQSPV